MILTKKLETTRAGHLRFLSVMLGFHLPSSWSILVFILVILHSVHTKPQVPSSGNSSGKATRKHLKTVQTRYRAGHLRYFCIFSVMKNDIFCIFYQVNLTVVGVLNRTGAELGYMEIDFKEISTFNFKIPQLPNYGHAVASENCTDMQNFSLLSEILEAYTELTALKRWISSNLNYWFAKCKLTKIDGSLWITIGGQDGRENGATFYFPPPVSQRFFPLYTCLA